MDRHSFLEKTSVGIIGTVVLANTGDKSPSGKDDKIASKAFITKNQNHINYYSEVIESPLKIILAVDTHLSKSDEREDPYRQYSDRMAQAYNQTRHYETGELTNPEETFNGIIKRAVDSEADLIALPGDLVSWPSEAAIEWAHSKLEEAGLPYIYVAGNHDWHYEGMEGSLDELRKTWIKKRLTPLYQGKNPLMAAYDIKGIRFLAIDNSTYQISQEQLDFFKDQVQSKKPLILLVHIPLYAPGRSIFYGCGHPEWGAETDPYHEIERRPKWPKKGHTQTTMEFYKEVFEASNLLGVFAGHIHHSSVDFINSTPQFVANDNASGAYLDIKLNSLSSSDRDLF